MVGMLELKYSRNAGERAEQYCVMKIFVHISQETLPSVMSRFGTLSERESMSHHISAKVRFCPIMLGLIQNAELVQTWEQVAKLKSSVSFPTIVEESKVNIGRM